MEVSESTLRGLTLLGEEAKISAAALKDLLTVSFKDATSNLNTAIASMILLLVILVGNFWKLLETSFENGGRFSSVIMCLQTLNFFFFFFLLSFSSLDRPQ